MFWLHRALKTPLAGTSGFAIAISLLLGACATEIQKNLLEWRAYEMTADMVVDGSPVRLQRTVDCEVEVRRFGFGITHPSARWEEKRKSVGMALPSGAAIMLQTPSICRRGWKSGFPVPADHMPLVMWLDDAKNPQTMEMYYSSEALRQPNARIQFRQFKVREGTSLPARSSDGFDAFGAAKAGKGVPGHGYIVRTIAEADWSEQEAVRQHLQTITQPTDVRRFLLMHWRSTMWEFRRAIDDSASVTSLYLYPTPRDSSRKRSLAEYNSRKRKMINAWSNSQPLVKHAGVYELQSDKRGYVICYKDSDEEKSMIDDRKRRQYRMKFRLPNSSNVLSVNGNIFEKRFAIYDPRSRNIFLIYRQYCAFPKR